MGFNAHFEFQNTVNYFLNLSLGALTLTTAVWADDSPQIRPTYVPDQLIVRYVVDLAPRVSFPDTDPIPAPAPADLFAEAGVTVISDQAVTPPLVVEHVALVQLNTGTRFGEAYRKIQSFEIPSNSGWRLDFVQPNHLYWLDRPPGGRRIFNMSARAEVRDGDGVTIGGLVIPGEFARLVVIKVRGPSLAAFEVDGVLTNPVLRLHEGLDLILENDDWEDLREWEINLARNVCPSPDDTAEAMIVTYLDPGPYTAIVTDADGGTGIALLEMYVLDDFVVN